MTETVTDQEKQENAKVDKQEATKDESTERKESETFELGSNKSTGQNSSLSLEQPGIIKTDNVQTVDDFKNLMYKVSIVIIIFKVSLFP
ncbi:unnamed protein product [Onchocerca flexuosa]|uniref:Internalin n=1 Tax=Onchocerca flexuosa TaxID=387005 RepID=A0A183HLX4_9BILA|nr:unnamed protein product [Onchocerca flexuosa]